jgi:L,D-transpeptidase ErfK/SrfK
MYTAKTTSLLTLCILLTSLSAFGKSNTYGGKLCREDSAYSCYVTKRHDTWEKLFPDAEVRDVVMRINRMGIQIHPGMQLAIPHNLDNTNIMDYAPFPHQIAPAGENIIIVSLDKLAWGAYDAQGDLVRWGPASGGQSYCPDIHKPCRTMLGKFTIQQKQGAECFSTKFPVPRGGAPMPYCMFFHGGFALHGSYEVPGYNASHGCVRLLVQDAKWLNEEFTSEGTPVIISQQR